MEKFNEKFNILKTQFELDFVNVFIEKDTKLFIDPRAIREGDDDFSQECYSHIASFFEELIKCISEGRDFDANDLLSFSHEVKEIHLGDSKNKIDGKGIGGESQGILKALQKSKSVKTGFLQDIEDCALMIDNINRDKISDMIANIIKLPLAEYTQKQCELHNIPTQKKSLGYCWNPKANNWELAECFLPISEVNGKDNYILLVPKNIVRREPYLNYHDIYRNEILDFEMARYSHGGVSLVKATKC